MNRLSVLGLGLLGGSIGLAVRQRVKDCQVVGYAHRDETLQAALQCGAVQSGSTDLKACVRDADLVIICTPVGMLNQVLDEIAPVLSAGAVVTDVGSTKRSVVSHADRAMRGSNAHFVGSHPMAGSEKRGVQFAQADLFCNATCIVTPGESTDPNALRSVELFWEMLGMRLVRMSPEEHDRRICDVSHLPHAVAAALVAIQEERSLRLAGRGFSDMTRIASGDGGLWRDIFQDNRDNLKQSIQRLRGSLDELLQLVESGESERLRNWLDAVAATRSTWEQSGPRAGK